MVFEIELLYLIAMLATFIVLLLVVKMNSGVALMCSAVVGFVLSAIFSGTDLNILRHLIEGGFGYFDTILTIVCAMVFIEAISQNGGLDYFSAGLVKIFRKFPTILLICFMIFLMLPGMITGSSLSAVISAGAIVAPIMIKMGIPKGKTAAIIAFGAILGMIAPPINIPVMAICDVCDIPFTGFTLPLMLLTVPVAIFAVLFLSRTFKKVDAEGNALDCSHNKLEDIIILGVLGALLLFLIISSIFNPGQKNGYIYVSVIFALLYAGIVVIMLLAHPYKTELNLDEMAESVDFDILKRQSWTTILPLIILVVLFILQQALPRVIGILGTPILFVFAYIVAIFTGKKAPQIFKKNENGKLEGGVIYQGVAKSFGAMALLAGVGMFVQVMTLNGVRGWFVINALSLPNIGQYIAIAVAVPVFGGISAFGSASIMGGPFVMALLSSSQVITASALSLIAGLGEFLPPTAMSAKFAGEKCGCKGWSEATKEAIIPMAVCLVVAMLFIVLVAPTKIW